MKRKIVEKIVAPDSAEMAALRLEKETLASQVKRLVKAEGKLYEYQEQFDAQLKEYKELYDLSRKLNETLELATIFKLATEYIINNLGYERVLFFQRSEATGDYLVSAGDGYYNQEEKNAVMGLTVPCQAPSLSPFFFGKEYRICTEGTEEGELAALRTKFRMNEYLLYPLGSQATPAALLVVGNSAEQAEFYRRVSESEDSLLGIGNLVELLSSSLENQILYAGMRQALEQERLAEEKYRSIFENAVEGIYQTTPEGRFLNCNPATAAILGYDTPDEVIEGIDDIERRLYVDPQQRRKLYRMMLDGTVVNNFETEFYRKDGSIIWVRLSTRPFLNEKSELLYVDGIVQDITERKRTEESLNKLSQAVEQSPVSIVITDTEGHIEFVNPKFIQLTGYTLEEALGKNPSILNSGRTPLEVYRKLWETLHAGKIWEGEFLNKKKNGELFSEHATVSPIRNRDGIITHYLAIKEDITERKKLEAQLFQSQKMESIGRLAGGVAHDFNNMLSVIIGCAQLLMLRVPEGDKLRQYLDQISLAAQRSSDITRQLLAFSRKEIISPRQMNLNARIVDTLGTLGRLIGEDINLAFKPAVDLWNINADPSQVDQILVNLAVNARDAMANGGYLAIETANVHVSETYSGFHLDAAPGDYVQLTVNDSGCGMDQETLAQIFEPFFTTKEIGKGTGLGLATVYGIVRQNNGFINVYSEPGHGTTFQVYFPRMLGTADVESKVAEAEISGSGTVLLVEDDPLVRKATLQLLEEIGYTVIQTENPQEAIAICNKQEVRIDLILTDVVMPVMNGKEMVDIIESIRPGIRVLFMSGYTHDLVAQRGVVDEGRCFIQKPFSLNSLNKKINETLLGE